MLELGALSEQYHKEIADELIRHHIQNVILVGNESKIIYDNLPISINKYHFDTTNELCEKINDFLHNDDIVMIKASRGMHFDKILSTLRENKQCNSK